MVSVCIGNLVAIFVLLLTSISCTGLYYIGPKLRFVGIILWVLFHSFFVFVVLFRSLWEWQFSDTFKRDGYSYRKFLWYVYAHSHKARIMELISTFFIIIGILGSFTLYAISIYPIVNPAFGGGCFPNIQLIADQNDFNADDNFITYNIFINLDINSENVNISKPLRLLEQTSSSYIVLVEAESSDIDEYALVISKELVKGFRTVPP